MFFIGGLWLGYNYGMNLDDFSYEENGRRYIKPEVSLGEQNAFIDNLRGLQQDKTAEISRDTYNLGTAIPSNLGGLTGGSGYFRARYQTPQTNSMVSDLRAAAQSQALTTLLNNEISKAKKRYNDAYRAAKKRENASGSNTSGGNGAYLSGLTAEANNDKSGDLQDIRESSDAGTQLQKYQNELGPLKNLYESTKQKTGIAGSNGLWTWLTTPLPDYPIAGAQEKRRKRIEELEQAINNLNAGN